MYLIVEKNTRHFKFSCHPRFHLPGRRLYLPLMQKYSLISCTACKNFILNKNKYKKSTFLFIYNINSLYYKIQYKNNHKILRGKTQFNPQQLLEQVGRVVSTQIGVSLQTNKQIMFKYKLLLK